MKTKTLILSFFAAAVLVLSGCNINMATATPDLALTAAVQALAIQQTQVAQQLLQNSQNQASPAAGAATATPGAPLAASSNTVEPSSTSQQPQIINATLCWAGPGKKYEVVSALSKGQLVVVIGRGNTTGWIIVKNPRYSDPCWVQSFDIQLGPGIDVNSLQVFYPPTPTATP